MFLIYFHTVRRGNAEEVQLTISMKRVWIESFLDDLTFDSLDSWSWKYHVFPLTERFGFIIRFANNSDNEKTFFFNAVITFKQICFHNSSDYFSRWLRKMNEFINFIWIHRHNIARCFLDDVKKHSFLLQTFKLHFASNSIYLWSNFVFYQFLNILFFRNIIINVSRIFENTESSTYISLGSRIFKNSLKLSRLPKAFFWIGSPVICFVNSRVVKMF